MKHERIVCKNVDSGKRIDVFLFENSITASRSSAAELVLAGNVLLNGGKCKKSDIVNEGDVIDITLPALKELAARPEDIKIDIVYEDEHLLVVNKQKGMVVHPAPGNETGTLVNALLSHCKGSLSGINGIVRPGIVHRLDKDTSGLLIVAKTDKAHLKLAEQISKHTFKRQYEGVVFGSFREQSGVISLPVSRSKKDRKKMAVVLSGKQAVTEYQTIAVYGEHGVRYSHMRFVLKTGRTHQIRVHCAASGHPVAGDRVYGNAARDKKFFSLLEGQCLHAACIGFIHPETGEYVEFQAEFPEYFTQVLTRLQSWDRIL
jgi:23S rRNA pseudouridine1911/1915/1917 synthase